MNDSDGVRLIDRMSLQRAFRENPSASVDHEAWLRLLQGDSPDQFEAHPVPAAHLLALYLPRLAYLREKSSPLVPGLSEALRKIEARSSEILMGILFSDPEVGIGYMAWLDGDAREIVAYFVSRPEHRSRGGSET